MSRLRLYLDWLVWRQREKICRWRIRRDMKNYPYGEGSGWVRMTLDVMYSLITDALNIPFKDYTSVSHDD